MTFQWGGLADTTEGLDAQQPPAHATRHRSRVEVIGYEKHDISTHEDGSMLVSTVLTERFSGAIQGMGYADHLRVLRPDGSGITTGIERIVGSIDGRKGSFILTAHGRNHSNGEVSGSWTVQPGSGTGELAGIRGRGAFTAKPDVDGTMHAEDEFVCWFEDKPAADAGRDTEADAPAPTGT
ncbi:DUF3224 domain-containing protein [Pseudonocardia adelaidensis]|uniref:DUF3224 domain-containing protein n=1 Tax=Pseudonocardia adelaidensis TaxID=648754 RepID=A0ABP9PA97_9PSEU